MKKLILISIFFVFISPIHITCEECKEKCKILKNKIENIKIFLREDIINLEYQMKNENNLEYFRYFNGKRDAYQDILDYLHD